MLVCPIGLKDGLTSEEMMPYIQRVLDQPNNWMIHSTALLERSWLEYEKRRMADRAMLQVSIMMINNGDPFRTIVNYILLLESIPELL